MIFPQGSSNCEAPLMKAIATGTVREWSVMVNVKANKNSFQAKMKDSSPVVTKDGASSGRKTLKIIASGLAPSMIAASSRLLGICCTKVVKIQMVNGKV